MTVGLIRTPLIPTDVFDKRVGASFGLLIAVAAMLWAASLGMRAVVGCTSVIACDGCDVETGAGKTRGLGCCNSVRGSLKTTAAFALDVSEVLVSE